MEGYPRALAQLQQNTLNGRVFLTVLDQAGGHVTDGRLLGRVEVSRSFGDRAFKKVGMSAVPDLRAFQLGHSDRFILMGCDGFWGVRC